MLYEFDYYAPKTIKEASELLLNLPDAKIMAGGTDLLVNIRAGKERPSAVIDIKRIKGLNQIEWKGNYLSIGALTLFNQLLENDIIRNKYKVLYECASVMGCYEIRNKATIGGNIMNASPGAESGSPLFVLEAEVVLEDGENKRQLKISEFVKGVGKTDIKRGEILTEILIPKYPDNMRSTYFRGRRVKGMDLASLNLAMLILNPDDDSDREIRVAMGAVHITPLRIPEIEEMLSKKKLTVEILEKVKKRVAELINPRATSLRATPEYKKVMVGNFIEMGLEKLLGMKFY